MIILIEGIRLLIISDGFIMPTKLSIHGTLIRQNICINRFKSKCLGVKLYRLHQLICIKKIVSQLNLGITVIKFTGGNTFKHCNLLLMINNWRFYWHCCLYSFRSCRIFLPVEINHSNQTPFHKGYDDKNCLFFSFSLFPNSQQQ